MNTQENFNKKLYIKTEQFDHIRNSWIPLCTDDTDELVGFYFPLAVGRKSFDKKQFALVAFGDGSLELFAAGANIKATKKDLTTVGQIVETLDIAEYRYPHPFPELNISLV